MVVRKAWVVLSAFARLARAVIEKSFDGFTVDALRIPSTLLLVVVVTHMAYDPIGSLYPTNQVRAAANWHSVLRAIEATVLYLAVWTLLPWRPLAVRLAGSMVCAWGAIESFQIALWRLQFPMNKPAPATALYTGLGDVVTGWPLYMLTICVVLLVTYFTKPKKEGQ